MYLVENDRVRRLLSVRLTGFVRLDEMQSWDAHYRAQVDTYAGQPHAVLADMRGLDPLGADVADVLRDAIAYARQHGTVCCAHLSDSTISRLQARRLAREADAGGVTINVVSLEEGRAAIDELLARLLRPATGT
jgi:hypothetical protein